jgi:hypothetical protein
MAEVVRYIVMPWGNGFFLPMILGCWQWHRREGLPSLVVLLGPIVLALGAAYLGKYPFCAARVLAYSAPAVVLLIAAGMPSVMWMPVFPGFRRIWQGLWILYLVTAVGYTGYRCVIPWTRPASDTASAYVLNHSQSDSLIIWNHWDYEYYFRHVGEERKCSCYQGEFTHGGPWPDEVWVLYTSIHRPEECPLAPPANYKLAERIDFTMTSCFHFRRVP